MDAVKMLGETVKKTAELTKDDDSHWMCEACYFLQLLRMITIYGRCFPWRYRRGCCHQCRCQRTGVVKRAIEEVRGQDFGVLCETIKKTAFKVTRVGQLVAQEASRRLNVPFGIIDLSLAPTPGRGRQCC